ncbi:MAG: hypothetical protein HC862_01590 [Scytonema sp. RU_4_4]|nr:hypothetical protein [Scytonema sp. RU_4_4]
MSAKSVQRSAIAPNALSRAIAYITPITKSAIASPLGGAAQTLLPLAERPH